MPASRTCEGPSGRGSAPAATSIKLQTQFRRWSAGDTGVAIQRDNEPFTTSLIFASN